MKFSRSLVQAVLFGLAIAASSFGARVAISQDVPISAEIPDQGLTFLETNCLECHDSDLAEAGVDLSVYDFDVSSAEKVAMWERVMTAVSDGVMPPQDQKRPTSIQRTEFLSWLDRALLNAGSVQRTGVRPLTRSELESTLEETFRLSLDLSDMSFPRNRKAHFDRIAEGSFVSSHLLTMYQAAGERVVDALSLQREEIVEPKIWELGVEQFNNSYSSITVKGDRVWLASGVEDVIRSSTWPTRFIAPADGIYKLTFRLAGLSDDSPLRLDIHAQNPLLPEGGISTKRHLAFVELNSDHERVTTVEIALQAGEVPLFYLSSSPLKLEGDLFETYLDSLFRKHPEFLSVLLSAEHHELSQWRGSAGYQKLLDLSKLEEHRNRGVGKGHPGYRRLIHWIKQSRALFAETFVHHHVEHGPSLALSGVSVEGPLAPFWSPRDERIEQSLKFFYGRLLVGDAIDESLRLSDDRKEISNWLRGVLRRAFRSYPTESEVICYTDLIIGTSKEAGATIEEITRKLVAKLVVSDRFLFHQHPMASEEEMLAARLSFMLSSRPPSGSLWQEAGELFSKSGMQKHAAELLQRSSSQAFYEEFVGQWLHVSDIRQIMPDQKFRFNDRLFRGIEEEPVKFFQLMVEEDRPLEDFFDPDFVYTSPFVASRIYGIPDVLVPDRRPANQWVPEKITISADHPNRGLIGMAAPLMATSNGVDTELVHRGVWFLESILGRDLPGPPEAVPAITPDTNGARTPAALLRKHTAHKGCVSCHQKIDPFGVVLERFDPIGRVRESYETGARIDAEVTTFDGRELRDVEDLRQWMLQNIDQFGVGLGVRLLEYGVGRRLNYTERDEVKKLVVKLQSAGELRTRTFLLELLTTDTFKSL